MCPLLHDRKVGVRMKALLLQRTMEQDYMVLMRRALAVVHCLSDAEDAVQTACCIRSYYVTPFQNQEAYVWYASANRMCLPSKNITNYNYYQNMLRVLAYFCKNQMSIDSAQALITALFAEVIHCE